MYRKVYGGIKYVGLFVTTRAAFEARCAMKHCVLLENTVNVGQGRALVVTEYQMSSAILFRHNPKTATGVCVLPDSPKTPRALSTFHNMSVHLRVHCEHALARMRVCIACLTKDHTS